MSLFSEKETVKLDVKGMHCQNCVAHVTEALEKVDGVTSASVSLSKESAVVEGRGLSVEDLVAAVAEAGFEASPAQ